MCEKLTVAQLSGNSFGKVCALELPGFVSVHAMADVTDAQI
jgi:hypothetical protein